MESGECSRMIGRCTEHFFCLKIGKIDVTGSDVDVGVIALCQFLISTAVIFDHTKGRIVFGIALIKNTASVLDKQEKMSYYCINRLVQRYIAGGFAEKCRYTNSKSFYRQRRQIEHSQ